MHSKRFYGFHEYQRLLTFAPSVRAEEQNSFADDVLIDVFEDLLRILQLLRH